MGQKLHEEGESGKESFLRWKVEKTMRERYIEEKRSSYGEKRREKREEEEELKNLRREANIWRFINKKRNEILNVEKLY